MTKEEFCYIATNDEDINGIKEEILLYESITAPIEEGEELGILLYKIGEKELGRIPLVSKEKIEKATYIDYIKELLRLLTEKQEKGIVIEDA